MHLRTLLAFVAAAMAAHAAALQNGSTILVNFNATPNNADMLWLIDNSTFVPTGSGTLTTTLFNGSTALGTYVLPYGPGPAPPTPPPQLPGIFGQSVAGFVYNSTFVSPTSPFDTAAPPPTVANFSAIDSGTMQGLLRITVSGATIANFDPTSLVLGLGHGLGPDALSLVNGATITSVQILGNGRGASVPEPASVALLPIGMLGLAWLRRRWAR